MLSGSLRKFEIITQIESFSVEKTKNVFSGTFK